MEHDNNIYFYLGLMALVLVGLALFLPNNYLTGNVVGDSCDELGCAELCTPGEGFEEYDPADKDAVAPKGTCAEGVCCPTVWRDDTLNIVGLCDLPENCGAIAEYSTQTTMSKWQRTTAANEEEPQAIQNIGWGTFWFPMLVTFIVVISVILRAKTKELKK